MSSKGLRSMRSMINVHIDNSFPTVAALHDHLKRLDLLNMERLRPGWDTYFMVSYAERAISCHLKSWQTLASLASHRSNCMKRRVGAVIVRDKRIVSTGYVSSVKLIQITHLSSCTSAIMEHRVS